MNDMTDKFKAVCEKHGIDPDSFPYDFAPSSIVDYSVILDAMYWVMEQKVSNDT
jgi:hypothetical protein